MASTRLQERVASALLLCLLGWQLYTLSTNVGSSRSLAFRAFEPHAGEEESLPVEIVEAIDLVHADVAGLQGRLRLAPSIGTDSLLLQRSVEALYPIRVSDQAPIVLARRNENTVSACNELRHSSHMGLYDCRPFH